MQSPLDNRPTIDSTTIECSTAAGGKDLEQLQRPETLTEAVANHIRDAIVRGVYLPGAQLSEAALASALGTSRGTIREALLALSHGGLVIIRAHRGASVATLTPGQAEETYSLRALLEPYAARLAIERGRVDATVIRDLRRAVDALSTAIASHDFDACVEADMHFHARMSATSGHVILQQLLGVLAAHTRRFIILSNLRKDDMIGDVESHARLISALLSGDPEIAEREVRMHIEDAATRVLQAATSESSNHEQSARVMFAAEHQRGRRQPNPHALAGDPAEGATSPARRNPPV